MSTGIVSPNQVFAHLSHLLDHLFRLAAIYLPRRTHRSAIIMLRHMILLLTAGVLAHAQDLPLISRDASGNLHVTTELGATLFVNGVPVNTSAMALQNGLEERLARLESVITTTEDGVTIVGGSRGAFLSRGQQYTVVEGTSAWEPSSLAGVKVGDTVTWKWSGLDAVFETVNAASATAKVGGYTSGSNPSLGGELSVRFTFPGTYFLRSASKGYVSTVVVRGIGLGQDTTSSFKIGGICIMQGSSSFNRIFYFGPGVVSAMSQSSQKANVCSCTPGYTYAEHGWYDSNYKPIVVYCYAT